MTGNNLEDMKRKLTCIGGLCGVACPRRENRGSFGTDGAAGGSFDAGHGHA